MGKRSDFERKERDYYPTIDERAVLALRPHLTGISTYIEPCAGKGHLVDLLNAHTSLKCIWVSDLEEGLDALSITDTTADAIITNPPWSRHLLHPLIMHLKDLAPTYLLLDADWAHTKQAIHYMKFCSDIISVGRLIWIEGTKTTGKDNCCWYRFQKEETQTLFHTRQI